MWRVKTIVVTLLLSSLSALAPQTALAAAATGVGVTTNNLLMYFDAGNYAGISGTTVTDLAGNNYSGTMIQTSSKPSLATSNGRYLEFTGNGGYVDLPDVTTYSNWGGLSVSFYANMGTRTVVERIFDLGMGQANNNIWVGMGDGNNMAIEVWRDGAALGWCRSADNSVVANEWAHWTAVLNGSTCIWYKNNVFSRSTNYSYLPLAKTLTNNYLGKSNWADPAFEGGIADLAIYNSVLSDSERTQNFNAQTDITAPSLISSMLSSPENSLSVTTLSTGQTAYFTLISGGDSDKVNLSSSGILTFRDNPNFEAAADSGGDNQYGFNVRFMDANGNFNEGYVQITVTNIDELSALTSPTLSANPTKGVPVTITVTPSGDGSSLPGRVTYLFAGKRIPSCNKKIYSGTGNSTCIWKPITTGNREITVTFTPTNTSFAAATVKRTFFINKRSTTR